MATKVMFPRGMVPYLWKDEHKFLIFKRLNIYKVLADGYKNMLLF